MKIETFGTIPPDVTEAARQCKLPRYLVCGVDVYSCDLGVKEPEIAGRHYRLIDLTDPDVSISCTTIADLVTELRAKISDTTNFSLNFIDEEIDSKTGERKPGEIEEFDECESIFKLTSLTREEMEELLKG